MTLDWNSLTPASTNPVIMRYRANGGSWTSANMTYGSGHWTATLPQPNANSGNVLDFYVRAEAEDENENHFYTCFPTQAQFAFSPYQFDLDYDPEERDYFTVVSSASAKATPLSQDFHGTVTGWTTSTTSGDDDWVRGLPEYAAFGEQPSFDYPFDSSSGFVMPKCYFTGTDNTHVEENKTYTLTSPEFSLNGASAAVISYALWFYVRDGIADDDKFVVEIGDGSSSWTTIQTIAADDCPAGERCWNDPEIDDANYHYAKVRWVRQRVRITSNLTTGRYLRFRAIRSNGSLAVMETCVDEVRVWATY